MNFEKKKKSHSQTVKALNVRASEEDKVSLKANTPVNSASSVPYTPLTKSKRVSSIKYNERYLESDILSALNGLREDDNIELFDILNTLLHFNIDKNVKERIMEKIEIILNNKEKWFPILDEVKKE